MSINVNIIEYIKQVSCEDIKQFCKSSLNKFGINYFLFVKRFPDRTRLFITNNSEWSEYYYQKEYYSISAFENHYKDYKSGNFVWSTLPGQKVFEDARNYFDIDHGITIVEKSEDDWEFFHFGTISQNTTILNFYMNFIEFIKVFIYQFKERYDGLIKSAYLNRLMLPTPIRDRQEDLSPIANFSSECLCLSPLTKSCDKFNCSFMRLTTREIECIKWLKKGKGAYEISVILDISQRTAEEHIKNIKAKLNCYNLFQLGFKISELEKKHPIG